MIFDEFPIPLTWYNDLNLQNRFKENVNSEHVFELLALNDRILPFQFRTDLGAVIYTLAVFDEDNHQVLLLDPSQVLSEAVAGYQYFTWLSDEHFTDAIFLSALDLTCNSKYYLKCTFTNINIAPLYSEVFTVRDSVSNLFVLEWYNSVGDIDPVYYGNGYVNRLYSDTFITKGLPTVITETEKDGFGNVIVISKTMINNFDFSLLIVPNFIVIAINFMSLHNFVYIETKQAARSGYLDNVTVVQDQINTLALFELTVKFTQQFYFSGSCATAIASFEEETIIINTGTPAQLFDLVYDAN